ncbi:MAG: flagella basal body P-ring formation protein FlgA [Halioglobus sp.]
MPDIYFLYLSTQYGVFWDFSGYKNGKLPPPWQSLPPIRTSANNWHERCCKTVTSEFERIMTIFWRWCFWAPLGVVGFSLFMSYASAGTNQPLDGITTAAKSAGEARALQHGYDNVSVEVRPLDPRLRLPQCMEPLSSFIPQASNVLGSVSVGIGCAGAKPWTIYVRTHISAQQAVPVLVRPLARNTLITQADITMINQPINSSANGVIFDPLQIIGMELTRQLDAGSTIRLNHLRRPKVIKRGQHVTLVTGLNGLEVRIQGKALGDAASGERVSVTNLSSGKQIEGLARSDGTVSVP